MGVAPFVRLCDRLSKAYGPRFTPPDLLIDMAKRHETFYGNFMGKQTSAA